jgi:hypothetical protein
MGCELNPRIIYTEFTAIIRKQKEVFTIFRYSFIVLFLPLWKIGSRLSNI